MYRSLTQRVEPALPSTRIEPCIQSAAVSYRIAP